ncbi:MULTISPECIES: acyl carrier protein [unclassified Anabaena]|uniref:PuwD n=1 Tax=Anabaena sp. UHCC-0399 TaxID=2303154 RepID=A0A346GB58_9NOST|nr:acyl carrier protein [Anabaena sp. UHCC 0399]AXN93612.1 PuwD [Anabaena sp. UHCC-0399]MEA5568660.1 acyl carrier protein [Anabaena sp. UHCC 0399]
MTTANTKTIPSTEQIQDWLISYMADMLEITTNEVDIRMLFDEYGLDSSMTIGMIGDLETWLGCNLDPTLVYDYSTIEDLAKHLGSNLISDNLL